MVAMLRTGGCHCAPPMRGYKGTSCPSEHLAPLHVWGRRATALLGYGVESPRMLGAMPWPRGGNVRNACDGGKPPEVFRHLHDLGVGNLLCLCLSLNDPLKECAECVHSSKAIWIPGINNSQLGSNLLSQGQSGPSPAPPRGNIIFFSRYKKQGTINTTKSPNGTCMHMCAPPLSDSLAGHWHSRRHAAAAPAPPRTDLATSPRHACTLQNGGIFPPYFAHQVVCHIPLPPMLFLACNLDRRDFWASTRTEYCSCTCMYGAGMNGYYIMHCSHSGHRCKERQKYNPHCEVPRRRTTAPQSVCPVHQRRS